MIDSPLQAGAPRMQWISRSVRGLALIGMVAVVFFSIKFWLDKDWICQVTASDWDMPCSRLQLDGTSRLIAGLATVPSVLLILGALWQLWRLFGWYERGEIFHPQPIHHLRRFGQLVVAMAPVMPLTDTLTVIALSWHNPPGHRLLMLHVGSQHYVQLLLGLVLLAMGQVMREAQRMAQENAEFV